ncbi:AMP-dependent synthetase/ligase [Faecalibacter bovis]|uniref:Long-chain fatty acid--CoA ligase n=1 Tax=Faecalibacter bovis TaxID=2898187 RepID=A0ABX7XAX2_9FLAO|nr:long-chain fatty acid--CoA ligase [Faecalibacter bovis]QTV05014.1 long-chain fatty acid--CoA ligase [Faecalibacter bovis]
MNNPTRIFDLAYRQAELWPDNNMFATKIDGEWKFTKPSEFIEQTKAISKGLLALGIKPGDKVGLVCESRYEWHVIDFAIQQIGAVVVAVYPNITDAEYQFIFNDAEISLCIVSNKNLYNRISKLMDSMFNLQYIFAINEFPDSRNWTELIKIGQDISDEYVSNLSQAVRPTDLATLIYTSGTSGRPKGVMLSHNNMVSNFKASNELLVLEPGTRGLTFLPPCHAYERTVIYCYLNLGINVYFAEGLEKIGENISEVKPHIMTAVPRLMEKVYEKIIKTGSTLTGTKRKIFDWAVEVAAEYEPDASKRSLAYNMKLAVARKLVLNKFYEALGGNFKNIISGSASLQGRIARVFMASGLPFYEGYGMTETSPLITVNNPYRLGVRIGTVGSPISGVEVKLAEDGEILVKGPNVMMGYYKNPEATAEVIIDGWLHTGDIGTWIEGEGKFLKIIDRKKEMFKISGGKYVVPAPIENKLTESNFIDQAMVVGDGEKFPSALIVPNFANLKEWAEVAAPEIAKLPKIEFYKQSEVQKKINQEIRQANQFFGNWEQLKKCVIISDEFTIEGGELTPTLKKKRKVIAEKYKTEIENIFK